MSSTPALPHQPSPGLDEQSGWFPSDRSAKSRFKALFARTKSQDKIPRQYVGETFPTHPSVQPLEPRPTGPTSANGDARRSRSTTWTKGNRTSQRSVKQQQAPRNLTSWDPPPLIQAYTQAKKQGILDIPSSLADVLFRGSHGQRSSVSSATSSASNLEHCASPTAVEEPSTKHRRDWSSASTSSASQKQFVLTGSGHVLQYSVDGLNDRLPEKILELGPESVAFASDAIPGKHWVLRISHDGRLNQTDSQSSKTAWSKWSFRSHENKKLVKDLLLVCDNAKSLGSWLTAVRKEIEHLGGLEYRPDSREDEPGSDAGRSLKAQTSFPSFSQSSPHLPMARSFEEQPPSPALLPPMPRWSTKRNISRSTTESSIQTLNDLDRIRNPSFSDDRSISTTHTSFTGSIASVSYGSDFFSNSLDGCEAPLPPLPSGTQSRLSTPTQDDVGELSMFMDTPRKPSTRVYIPKRTTSLEPTPDMISHDLFVQTDDSCEAAPAQKPRPISTIAPLPEPGHIRKISARHRYEIAGTIPHPNTPTSSRPTSTRSRSNSYTQDTSPDGQKRTASYSLFPKTPSTEQSQLHGPMDLPSPPVTTPGTAYESMCCLSGVSPATTTSTDEENESKLRSRSSSTTSRPSHRRTGTVLSINSKAAESAKAHVGRPQRSPAVTEEHLETCFGADPNAPRRKGSADGSMFAISSTTLERSTLEGPVVRMGDPPRKHRHVRSQKSMPTLVHRSMLPLGPPPSGPLPALPTEACLPLGTTKITSSLSCVQIKHTQAESSNAVIAPKKPVPVLAAAPTFAQKQTPTSTKATAHSRNGSSISSVGSVRHVTAWLASPRVAAFSAKYDEENEPLARTGAPRLDVSFTDSPAFSTGFDTLMH